MQELQDSQENSQAEKRKRSEHSSTSELETSTLGGNSSHTNAKSKKKSKKAGKTEQTIDEYFSGASEDRHNRNEIKEIRQELKELNSKLTNIIYKVDKSDKKLENVVRKDDGSLRTVFREIMNEMKQELLNSVVNRLELLESRLYDRDRKNDELKTEVTRLEKEVSTQRKENESLKGQIEVNDDRMTKLNNDTEQYSRINNIRIQGIVSSNAFETAEETTNIVVKTLNEKMSLKLRREDIDVAHRMKKFVGGSQEAIVRLQSRMVKETILRNRRSLRGSDIYINEDLTQLNQQVFMSVKRKMPDEVSSVFTRNGVVKYVTRTNELKTVQYKDYQHWLDLPWPTRGTRSPDTRRT